MFKRLFKRKRFPLILTLFIILLLIHINLKKKEESLEIKFVKNLIVEKKEEQCSEILNSISNLLMINQISQTKYRNLLKNCQFSSKDLSGLLGSYEITGHEFFSSHARNIFNQEYHRFDTPSGLPVKNSSTISIELIADYAIEYYYLGDLQGNFTFISLVEKGLKTIKSLIALNHSLQVINVYDPLTFTQKGKILNLNIRVKNK